MIQLFSSVYTKLLINPSFKILNLNYIINQLLMIFLFFLLINLYFSDLNKLSFITSNIWKTLKFNVNQSIYVFFPILLTSNLWQLQYWKTTLYNSSFFFFFKTVRTSQENLILQNWSNISPIVFNWQTFFYTDLIHLLK